MMLLFNIMDFIFIWINSFTQIQVTDPVFEKQGISAHARWFGIFVGLLDFCVSIQAQGF